jgi:hypothetical protein
MSALFRTKNQSLHREAVAILEAEQPITLRGLLYRLISAGMLANSQKEYRRLGKVMTRLREAGEVPFSWIVDHVRSTLKPSSWSGLDDFGDTVRQAYRKDLWAQMPHHVEIFVEKDAIAGTIQPVTSEYDIALQVCRGYASLSFVGEIAQHWTKINKPIFAYYLGDYDPSGFDIERDLREKLTRYSGLHYADMPGSSDLAARCRLIRSQVKRARNERHGGGTIFWSRLAILENDFEEHDLIELPVKNGDNRARTFRRDYGDRCAEVDALPPTELRRRVREIVEAHIDQKRWRKLKEVERLEQETVIDFTSNWQKKSDLGSVSRNGDDADEGGQG